MVSWLFDFKALGTEWSIELLQSGEDQKVKQKIIAIVRQFEDAYSRFKTGSDLSRLNAVGVFKNPSPEFIDMLRYTLDMHEKTDGVFDISVGSILESAGYGKGDNKKVHYRPGELANNIVISSRSIKLRNGIRIDFGGFGKGWLIDKIAQELLSLGKHGYVINGGGDLFVSSDHPLQISMAHPLDSNLEVGTTKIIKGAMAVSSPKVRTWHSSTNENWHHIIDPRSAKSSKSQIASVYVRADTALLADTIATVLVIQPQLKQRLVEEFDVRVVIIYDDQLGHTKN